MASRRTFTESAGEISCAFKISLEQFIVPCALRLRKTGALVKPPPNDMEELLQEVSRCLVPVVGGRSGPDQWVALFANYCVVYRSCIEMLEDPEETEHCWYVLDAVCSLLESLRCYTAIKKLP